MHTLLGFKSRAANPHLLASLLFLTSLPSLGACSEEDGVVRVNGASTDRIWGYGSKGRVEATYVDDGQGQGHWELSLPDGGSVETSLSVNVSPSQGSYSYSKRVDGVRPGDSIEISPYGINDDPEGCRCQTANDPELDLGRVDAFIATKGADRSTSRRYSARPVPATDVGWYLTCDTLDYSELRERIGMMKCGSPTRIY